MRHRLDRILHAVQEEGRQPRLSGAVHADAIMDRIVHNAVWVDMGEADMRQCRG